MSTFSTNVGEKFAAKVIKIFYETAVTPQITNDNYEGQIKGGGADRLNVLSLTAPDLTDYTGADLTVADLTESEGTLIIDQKKAFYFRIKSWDKFKSYCEDEKDDAMDQEAGKLKQAIDTFVLGLYGDVAAGQRVGTSYTTGTVTITVTTGAVAGSGTTFAAGMVGKGFKATGHTLWYRIKTYTSATAIVIEDDSDDDASAYTGGAIGAGATYEIQANTCVTVTKSTIYGFLVDLKVYLNKAEIPDEDRWLVVNADIMGLLDKSDELIHATTAGDEVIRNGFRGTIAGFRLYENQRIAGDSTNGWHIVAGHKSAITFAHAFTETGIEDLQKNFGQAYKGLNCYGGKVIDRRRKAWTELFCKI
jgi:hypothetical protein